MNRQRRNAEAERQDRRYAREDNGAQYAVSTIVEEADEVIVDEYNEAPACPMCGGDGGHMGALGRLEWFRCIQCGWQFSKEDGR